MGRFRAPIALAADVFQVLPGHAPKPRLRVLVRACRSWFQPTHVARNALRRHDTRVKGISDYRFGQVVVDGETHTRDVIVLPTRVVGNWWRKEGHSLVLEDLDDIIDEIPERLIVGCGAASQMRPDPETLEALRRRGIEVEVLPTAEAVRRFGACEPGRTAAALHLTC